MDDLVLTPHPGYRVGFVVTAALFVTAAAWNVPAVLDGSYAWTTVNRIGFPVVVLLAVTTTIAAVSALRHAVWVDDDGLVLRVRMLLRTRSMALVPPTTVALDVTPAAPGSTLVSTQRVLVRRPGEPTVTVSTPWVPSAAAVLALLGPALRHDPGLAADETTRHAIEVADRARRPLT